MSDDMVFPPPPSPDSGEEQYRLWVEQMTSDIRSGRMKVAQPATGDQIQQDPDSPDAPDSPDSPAYQRSVLPRPVVTLGQGAVEATPGQAVRVKVTVRNVGPVVETYALSAIGADTTWVSVVPSEVSLFPGDEGAAALVIKPPRTPRVPSADYPIGVMARSEVDPNESAVAQVTVSVAPYYDAAASLSRTTIDIRRRTSTYAQITNNGNTRVRMVLEVSDPDGYLRFKIDDPDFALDPGETAWKRIQIRGPLHIFGRPRTLSMLATVVSLVDETRQKPLQDVRTSVQRVTLIQRPLIRLRLGIFGRLVILLAVVGVIAAFVLSRIGLTGSTDVVSGPPPTPADFTAETYGTSQVLLRWSPAPGATGYSIYAVGDTGNALAEDGSTTSAPQAAAFSSALRIVRTSVTAGGGDSTASPAPSQAGSSNSSESSPSPQSSSSSSADPTSGTGTTELTMESPSCGDCTHVGDVPAGSARFVVTKTMPGENNCYRLIATDGQRSSLYTPMQCTYVPSAAEVEAQKAAAAPSSSESAPDPLPCPPYLPKAEKLTPEALALTWLMPSENKPAKKATGCSRKVTITGFEVQRQILSGWSTVTPAPGASDTALEVSGLDPATKYCFRMRSTAGSGSSDYTETFCGKTKKVPPLPTPDASDPATTDATAAPETGEAALEGPVFEPGVQ